MALFEDIGRTNQLAVSTGNLVNLSRQMRQDERLDQELGMKREVQDVQMAVSKIQLEKAQKEEAFNNQVLTVDQVFGMNPQIANSPTAQKRLLDLAGPAVVDVNGVKGITRGDMLKVQQGMQQNVEFQKILYDSVLQDHVGLKTSLMQQLNDPKIKPEQAQQIKQQLGQIEQTIGGILTTRNAMDKDAAKTAAEIELLKAKTKTEGAQQGYLGAKAREGVGGSRSNITKIQGELDKLEWARFNAVNKGQFEGALLGQLGIKDEAGVKTPEGLNRYTQYIDKRIETLNAQLEGNLSGGAAAPGLSKKELAPKASHSLTRDKAQEILREAGGDPRKAEQLARERGYRF
jgi:hypothetical protein